VRKKSVRQKLAPIISEFQGRNILLVDDSIVRGTTSGEIIQMARDAGAGKVYIASAAPPVRYPNVYGIDMPTKQELLAHRHDNNFVAIAKEIGADRIFYQELPDLISAIVDESTASGAKVREMDCSCFNGEYVTELATDYLNVLATVRTSDRGSKAMTSENALDKLQITDRKGSPPMQKPTAVS